MSEDFDIGPLTWVKDEIDKSLSAILDTLAKSDIHQDLSVLRFAKTHAYQASGALDMVGLQGCKYFCNEIEKTFDKVDKNEITLSPTLISQLIDAVHALKHYLDGLMRGAQDVPLRLYDALAPIVAAQGLTLEKSDLFFPDTTLSAPKTLVTTELSEPDYVKQVASQRLVYQKAFLGWLQTKQAEALNDMASAIRAVSQIQTRAVPKTMWWSASAFAESLLDSEVAENAGAKRLCRKIDQELKLLLDGQAKANPQMLKDILYYVAITQTDTETISQVKATFGLSRLIDHEPTQLASGIIDSEELNAVTELVKVIELVNEIWNEISNQIELTVNDLQVDTLIPLDNVLLTRCADALSAAQPFNQKLSQSAVVDMYEALNQAIQYLMQNVNTSHPVLIEIAAAVHLLQNALNDYTDLTAEYLQKLIAEIKRLELIASGETYHQLEQDRTQDLDADTISAVVAHLQASLKLVEQGLDSFFRNPEDKSTLVQAVKPLKQISGTFYMLNMEVPSNIAQVGLQFIDYFQSPAFISNQGEFELLAESLSMLGLYAEGMPKVRAEYESAMQSALERMQFLINQRAPQESMAIDPDRLVSVETISALNDELTVTDKAYDDELLDIYLTEAEEVLAHIAQNLLTLKTTSNQDALIEVRRSFHTLKGSARTVGLQALGEVAGKVETFLNGVIDKKSNLVAYQLSEIEEVTAAFANWVASLREQQFVNVNQETWLARVATWNENEKPQVKKKPEDEFVIIGGERKLSHQFYTIFLNESMLNITILEQDLAGIASDSNRGPSEKAKHAIHTLASNALAAGFNHMGELGRAVETWLDETGHQWTPAHHKIYARLVKTVARMWQAVSELKEPKEEKALLNAVLKATPSLNTPKQTAPKQISTGQTPTTEDTNALDTLTASSALETLSEEDAEVDEEILALFQEEADELLPQIGSELRAWKVAPSNLSHPEGLQRALHTLKGSARMAGKANLGNVVHHMEERVVQALKTKPDAQLFEHLFNDLDRIGAYFDTGQLSLDDETFSLTGLDELSEKVADSTIEEIATPLENALDVSEEDHNQPTTDKANLRAVNRKTQYLRMRADVLDRLINEAGEISIIRSRIDKEMLGFKHTSSDLTESVTRLRSYLREIEIEADTQLQSRLTLMQEANDKFDPLEFDRFTRLQELTRMMAESVNDITTIQNGLVVNLGLAEAALQQQARMNRDMQQGLMAVRMLPFSQLSERMERIVRQTARELNKKVEFKIEGDKTEIDRSVLDKIGAPLEHLLRNAVAHGIEAPLDRKNQGKPEAGTLTLKVSAANDEIHIVISDDGGGVNLKKVKEVAIKNKIIATDAKMTDQSLLAVIFEPGFSTSTEVTQISGRGVGLDVVRNDVSGLGGRIDVESKTGQGSQFSIYLPVTLTVAQVLMVRSGQTLYAISVSMIEQAQKIKKEALAQAEQTGGIEWAGNQYPLHHLAKLVNEVPEVQDDPYVSILLLRSGQYRIALMIDEMLGNQEVVIKPIGAELSRVPGIMGATVTGEGAVILIINPLIFANREVLATGALKVKVKDEPVAQKQKAMVVDDSLTMRKVLGRLMEKEGYEVILAKDGMDALQLLQQTTPDVILTDIEMPRLDGFGLSRNIRDDSRTAHTPLIMISSRTADKHQQLAKEIGVDAFFGKPVAEDELVASVKALITSKNQKH